MTINPTTRRVEARVDAIETILRYGLKRESRFVVLRKSKDDTDDHLTVSEHQAQILRAHGWEDVL